jgi:hypothetical protein
VPVISNCKQFENKIFLKYISGTPVQLWSYENCCSLPQLQWTRRLRFWKYNNSITTRHILGTAHLVSLWEFRQMHSGKRNCTGEGFDIEKFERHQEKR